MADQKKFEFPLSSAVLEDSKGKIEIKILEGSPEPYNTPVALDVHCTLESILNWITNPAQKEQVSIKDAVLILDYEAMTAVLNLNPKDKRAGTITGKAVLSQDYKDLKINEGAGKGGFSKADFESLVRRKRAIFPDKAEHAKLLAVLKNFKANYSGSIANQNDSRGSKNIQFQKVTTDTDLPEQFKVEIQLFKGTTLRSFWVDLCFDTSETNIVFWLESPEAEEAKRKATYDMMDNIKDKYTTFGIVVLQQ